MKIWIFFSVMIFSLPLWALWGAQPFSTGKTQEGLQSFVARHLVDQYPTDVGICLQYKCWSYEASVWLGVPPGATERDFKIMAIRGIKALHSALKQFPVNQRLYYDPSNLYLYDAFIHNEHCYDVLFFHAGVFKFTKTQQYLTHEEKKLFKDQLTSNPNTSITIWKKSFEEVAKEVGIDCSEITRDPRDVLNFSEDPAMREAIKIVRKRVLGILKEQGYVDYIAYLYERLALKNKSEANDWMFFVQKSLPTLSNKRKKSVPYNPRAYKAEYLRLLNMISEIINEAPELKPYLHHPIKLRDIQLSFMWYQQIIKNNDCLGSYHHLFYRTHNSLIMARSFDKSSIFNRDDKEEIIPLEEFFQSIGI